MLFNLLSIPPEYIHSLTKYPSIPTYHLLGNDGGLSEPSNEFTGLFVTTEKIDGCNARIIFTPDGEYLIGSREELLFSRGDYLANPAHGIVKALQPMAEAAWTHNLASHFGDAIVVVYVELYGGRKLTQASREYTSDESVGFRLFDVAVIANYTEIINTDAAHIASWRDNGGQAFLPEHELADFSTHSGIPLTPRLLDPLDSSELPRDIDATHAWLTQTASTSRATLDENARGRSEGMVIRSLDRSVIAKLRFQNYTRTQKLKEIAAKTTR